MNHELLQDIMAYLELPELLIKLVADMYNDGKLLYYDGTKTNCIREIVGLKQGCPLSPILFNLYAGALVNCVSGGDHGYQTRAGPRISALAFADDLLLIHDSQTLMAQMLETVARMAAALGLTINGNKSTSLALNFRSSSAGRVLNVVFQVNDMNIKKLDSASQIEYLGRPFGADDRTNSETLFADCQTRMRHITRSPLTPPPSAA